MDIHPSGPRPRVLPTEPFGSRAAPPTNAQGPDFAHQPGPPPSIPRRTKLHRPRSVGGSISEHLGPHESAGFPGNSRDFDSPTQHRQPGSSQQPMWSADTSQESSIYGCRGNSTHSVVETNSVQLQEQMHLLRIRVEDLNVENNKVGCGIDGVGIGV